MSWLRGIGRGVRPTLLYCSTLCWYIVNSSCMHVFIYSTPAFFGTNNTLGGCEPVTVQTRDVHPSKTRCILHIPPISTKVINSPYLRKIYINFPVFSSIYVFCLILFMFLASPNFDHNAFTHHALVYTYWTLLVKATKSASF